MSRMYALGWNNLPPELDDIDIRTAFDQSNISNYCSLRNRSGYVNPSRSILKAFFSMFSDANGLVRSAGIVHHPQISNKFTTIQLELGSNSSNREYGLHYAYDQKNNFAQVYHDCPATRDGRFCYHTMIATAIADIYFNPHGDFATAFKSVSECCHDSNWTLFGQRLVLAQDELYHDILDDNLMPFNEDQLLITNQSLTLEPIIETIYPYIDNTGQCTNSQSINIDEHLNQMNEIIKTMDRYMLFPSSE